MIISRMQAVLLCNYIVIFSLIAQITSRSGLALWSDNSDMAECNDFLLSLTCIYYFITRFMFESYYLIDMIREL
ncbi:MAG: hypothetical protein CME33_10635 [Gimesia sp.]|nr:hypothetical protein [Gimesia sp.]